MLFNIILFLRNLILKILIMFISLQLFNNIFIYIKHIIRVIQYDIKILYNILLLLLKKRAIFYIKIIFRLFNISLF